MFDKIVKDINDRIAAQPNSLAATDDEVTICWLVAEVCRLRKQNKECKMADGDFDNSDYQPFSKNEEKALELAREFRKYCKDNNYESSLVLAGVAWDGNHVKTEAYKKGAQDEKDRIKDILKL